MGGEGMQWYVSCTLHLKGSKRFIDIFEKGIEATIPGHSGHWIWTGQTKKT